MFDLEQCKYCIRKTTTSGCINCNIFRMKRAIDEFDEFLEAHKSNLSQFILYINNDYYDTLIKALKFDLSKNIDIRISNNLETNQVCVIVDKTALDWGDIYLER